MHALHFLQSEAVVAVHVSIGTLLSLMSNLPTLCHVQKRGWASQRCA